MAGAPPRLELYKNGVWRAGAVRAQNATGSVDIIFDDGEELRLDLDAEEYRWLASDASPCARGMLCCFVCTTSGVAQCYAEGKVIVELN